MITINNFKSLKKYLEIDNLELRNKLIDYYNDLIELTSIVNFEEYYKTNSIIKNEVDKAINYFNELITSGNIIISPIGLKRNEQRTYPHSVFLEKIQGNHKYETGNIYEKDLQSKTNLLNKAFSKGIDYSHGFKKSTYLTKLMSETNRIKEVKLIAKEIKLESNKHYILLEAKKLIGDIITEKTADEYGRNAFARELIKAYPPPTGFGMTTIKEILRRIIDHTHITTP